VALIDLVLPRYQFRERHAIAIAAPSPRVFQIVAAGDPTKQDRIVRAMMALRAAPSALFQKFRPAARPTMTDFGLHSFTPLAQDAEEFVVGLVGRFWRPDGGLRSIADAQAFLAFDEKGTAKLATNFRCEPQDGGGTRLTTETRVFCPDRRSRLLFAPYWFAIRPRSGFIRKRFLRAVKRAAEERP
jgi:hypothetical protein